MAAANVSYETLENAYKTSKYAGNVQVLGKDENGAVKVTKAKKIFKKIFYHFEIKEKNTQKSLMISLFI